MFLGEMLFFYETAFMVVADGQHKWSQIIPSVSIPLQTDLHVLVSGGRIYLSAAGWACLGDFLGLSLLLLGILDHPIGKSM